MLAALCVSDSAMTTVPVTDIADIEPRVFYHLLWCVYGGNLPEEELKAHAKDIMEAADKYSIVNLKLEAEAAFVETTTITMENAMDNLLYADAKNCALLKETVMDFLAENYDEAVSNISFTDFPSHLVKDLFVSMTRKLKGRKGGKENADDFGIMRVSELRKKLDERGLDADGSREAMIEALKSNAAESDSDDASDSDASSDSHFSVA
jgi:hypothetical protein